MTNIGAKTCFVISPIGPPDSDIRAHADEVLILIEEALQECGVRPLRSDHLKEPGRISAQMYRQIFGSDMCIAVLTGSNPNVYYELALAQSAGKPVIIMIESGHVLPFDIQDLRCVHYKLDITSYREKRYQKEIAAFVQELELKDWQTGTPFDEYLPDDETFGRSGQVSLLPQSEAFGPPENWLDLLDEARQVFEVCGVSLLSWRKSKGFRERLVAKLDAGCQVRVLVLAPDNPVLNEWVDVTKPEADLDGIRRSATKMFEYFDQIAGEHEGFRVRKIGRGCLHGQITRSDTSAILIPYLFGERPHRSPLLRAAAGTSLYKLIAAEFDALWTVNAE